MSTLLVIPWIIFGFTHPENRFIGLTQTGKSILTLLIIELILWTVLILLLGKPIPDVAGTGSFAWMYSYLYEKAIIPIWLIAENVNRSFGDKIDSDYKFIYLIVALLMDYLILFLISPRLIQIFRSRVISIDK